MCSGSSAKTRVESSARNVGKRFVMGSTPPKSDIDTKNDGPWKMYRNGLKDGVIVDIYVRFPGGRGDRSKKNEKVTDPHQSIPIS